MYFIRRTLINRERKCRLYFFEEVEPIESGNLDLSFSCCILAALLSFFLSLPNFVVDNHFLEVKS